MSSCLLCRNDLFQVGNFKHEKTAQKQLGSNFLSQWLIVQGKFPRNSVGYFEVANHAFNNEITRVFLYMTIRLFYQKFCYRGIRYNEFLVY